jgi:hypothetical protein
MASAPSVKLGSPGVAPTTATRLKGGAVVTAVQLDSSAERGQSEPSVADGHDDVVLVHLQRRLVRQSMKLDFVLDPIEPKIFEIITAFEPLSASRSDGGSFVLAPPATPPGTCVTGAATTLGPGGVGKPEVGAPIELGWACLLARRASEEDYR